MIFRMNERQISQVPEISSSKGFPIISLWKWACFCLMPSRCADFSCFIQFCLTWSLKLVDELRRFWTWNHQSMKNGKIFWNINSASVHLQESIIMFITFICTEVRERCSYFLVAILPIMNWGKALGCLASRFFLSRKWRVINRAYFIWSRAKSHQMSLVSLTM